MNYENAIEIEHLTKDYGSFRLDDVTLAVPGGTILGLIGENGAGKSTTIKCILNLVRRDAGEIRIFGMDNRKEERAVKEQVAVVLDECPFHELLTPHMVETILSGACPGWDSKRFHSLLGEFELPEKKLVKEFSRGMKMKLSIAAALARNPRVLLLDEATSGLDPVVRDRILELFLDFVSDESHAVLLSSHITSDLEKVADYITFIHAGKIVFSKTKDDILEQYGVVKCEKARAAALDGAHILGRRDSKFDAELLVDNRPEVARLYPGILTEQATIDDIMTFFAKGAYDA